MLLYPDMPDPLENVRRILDAQTQQLNEIRALSMAPFEAAPAALRSVGALQLNHLTIDTLTGMPSAEALRANSSLPDLASLYRINPDIIQQQNTFRDLAATLTSALDVSTFLRRLDFPTAEEMHTSHRRFLRAAKSLAKLGWTFPVSLTSREIGDLVTEYAKDPAGLDAWFEEFYAADYGSEFRSLATRLLRRANLKTWRSSIQECLWAYRRRKYRVTIPTLLATIEGLVSEVTGTIRDRGTNAFNHWRERAPRPPNGFMLDIEWRAITVFLGGLWARHHFDGTPPNRLNRHWVQHGRRPELGSSADALRLLAAIDFISTAVREVEALAGSRKRKSPKRHRQPRVR